MCSIQQDNPELFELIHGDKTSDLRDVEVGLGLRPNSKASSAKKESSLVLLSIEHRCAKIEQ